MKASYILSTVVLVMVVAVGSVRAQSVEQIKEFFLSVGCSGLPMGTCEALDAQNARSVFLTYRSALSSRFCGSANFNAARQLLEMGDATSPAECQALMALMRLKPSSSSSQNAARIDRCEKDCIEVMKVDFQNCPHVATGATESVAKACLIQRKQKADSCMDNCS